MLQTIVTKFYEVAEVAPQRLMFLRIALICNSIFLAFMAFVFQAGLLADIGLMIIIAGILLVVIARSLPQHQQPVIGHLTLGACY
ncbi:MAG: hypothetical protein GFH27_549323n41 [Chloroflexi bacterium AL-W]|nr:hypothetical protein [Chloroflexi bacterium AL-N1]NOK70192.1 hypothetical protein [Chloroflexi bacterium AL-N10]NOK77729.1 hypothetical protein [Chloroflexi bacterium AL-N5]NOK84738.1 hypothetical protein [Chloroflexi bacterium AL-W]NOK93199.1 hypothetical protein [Chloroflexi bacterium AL-N15]